MKRKLLLFFCVLSCVLMVSGCSLVRGNENFDKKTLEQQTDNFLTSWFAADFEGTISTYKDQMNDTTLAQYKLYAKQKAQYKGLKKKEKTEKAIARAEEAEKSAENNKAPETTDEAYERYMKNADLLCKQLSDLEGRQNAILDEAREQAEREREKARQDAADIIGEARKTAERLLKDAQENKENAIEEAKKIHEDSLRKVEEEKKQCDELSAQKAAMVNSLKKLTEDTARLMEKMQG